MSFLGLAAGALEAWDLRPHPREDRPVATWVADREAEALVGLDRDLIEVRRVPLRRPVGLARAPGERLWAALAVEDSPLGKHDIVLLDSGGGELLRRSVAPVLDLEGGESALWVEAGSEGEACARLLDASGDAKTLACVPGLSCAARQGEDVLLGTGSGEVVLIHVKAGASGDWSSRGELGSAVLDLAPAPDGGWWALTAAAADVEPSLVRMRGDLSVLWSVPLPAAARRLTADPGRERVWLSDPRRGTASRFGPEGRLEVEARLPLLGAEGGRALPDGGVLLAAPGALLRLDRRGILQPGQGGFAHLSAVVR